MHDGLCDATDPGKECVRCSGKTERSSLVLLQETAPPTSSLLSHNKMTAFGLGASEFAPCCGSVGLGQKSSGWTGMFCS